MSHNEVRVLNRRGARELTEDESQRIAGGIVPTLLSVILTGTPHSDQRLDE